jgi:hypothetical protein
VVTTASCPVVTIKMMYFTDVEKAKGVLQFKQIHLVALAQQWFCTSYDKEARIRKLIYKWHKSFAETDCICAKKNSGRQPNDETVKHVCAPLLRGPKKSIRQSCRKLCHVYHAT